MFMLAFSAPESAHSAVTDRLQSHLEELARANTSFRLSTQAHGETTLLFDEGSPFAEYSKVGEGFSLRGGFRTGGDIGEYAEIELTAAEDGPLLIGKTDPYASWPLYYGQSEVGVAISNDPHALAIALRLTKLNASSVFQFVTLQFVVNRCTTIDGVYRLWQGESVSFTADEGGRSLEPHVVKDRPGSVFQGSADVSEEALRRQVDRAFGQLVEALPYYDLESDDVVSTLSGGLDSRLVLGAMRVSGVEHAEALTFNLVAGDEGDVAAAVAGRLGYAHTIADLPEGDIDMIRQAWLLTGGQKTVHAAADNLLISRQALGNRSHVRLVTATVGDPLDGTLVPPFSQFLNPHGVGVCVQYWLRALTSNVAAEQGLGKGRVARKNLRMLRRELVTQFKTAQGRTAAEKMTNWDYTRRGPVFSHVTTSKLSSNVLEMQPALAPGYVDSFYKLRPLDILQRNFYRKLIWTVLPELRDIPNHNSGQPVSPEYISPVSMSWKLKLLLRLPIAVHLWVEDKLAGRSLQRDAESVPSETLYYQSLIEPLLGQSVELAPGLTFRQGDMRSSRFQEVNTAAAVLACLWTKDYIATD